MQPSLNQKFPWRGWLGASSRYFHAPPARDACTDTSTSLKGLMREIDRRGSSGRLGGGLGGGGGSVVSKNLSIVRNIGKPSIFLYLLITFLNSHHSFYIVPQEDSKKAFQDGKKYYLAGS